MTDIMPAKSPHGRERGQSLVELAISLTVMLLLLSGAVSFGMALFSYVAIRDAAGEGALYGSIRPYIDGSNGFAADSQFQVGEALNAAEICARVKAASDRPVNMSSFQCTQGVYGSSGNNTGFAIDVSATNAPNYCEGTGSSSANGLLITVDYDQGIFMPFMGAITGDHIHLRAQVTNTILEPRCPSP